MTVISWLFLVVFGYAALTVWFAHVMRAFRLKQIPLVIGLLAVPPVLLVVMPFLPEALRAVLFEFLFLGLSLLLGRALAPKEALIPKRETKTSLLHLVLMSGSALFLVPFVWLVVTSLKEDSQMAKFPPEWIPTQQVTAQVNGHSAGLATIMDGGREVPIYVIHSNSDGTLNVVGRTDQSFQRTVSRADITQEREFKPLWKNYSDAMKFLPPESHYGLVNLQNTLIIALLGVVGAVLSSSLVAYSFARLTWPGRDWLFGILLATMMLPDAVTMMPRFLIFRDLHWIDTLYPLWVPSFFASAFNVFLLRQFFMGIPQEMEDAAKIDGCTYLGTYWHVMLPMVKPALAAVAIMTFIGAWKDFMNPLIYISSPEKMPLSYVLQLFNSAHGGEPGMLMAATTMVMLPVVLLFFFTQRYFIEGVSITGLGGR